MESISYMINSAVNDDMAKHLEFILSAESKISMNFLLYEYLPEVQKQNPKLSKFHNKTINMDFFTWAVHEKSEFWRNKFVESLLIIQAYESIHSLSLNITTLKKYFLPKTPSISFFVHPVKKVLYAISESLSAVERADIIQSIVEEGKCTALESDKFDVQHFEFFLMKLIDLEYITVGTWSDHYDKSISQTDHVRSNVQNFARHLKKYNFYQLFDCLIASEKLINKDLEIETNLYSEETITDTGIMNFGNFLGNISLSSDQLSYLECNLEVFEKLSIVFLLFENAAEARDEFNITNFVVQANKNVKMKYFYNCEINLFSKWMLTFPQDWKEKLIECLLIIRPKKVIQCLGLNALTKYYILPELRKVTSFIHPVKKILYYMSESLTENDKSSLIESIIMEEIEIEDGFDSDNFEEFLLKLIEMKYIDIGSWNDSTEEKIKADVQKLARHLKHQGFLTFYEHLLESEKMVNERLDDCKITTEAATLPTINNDFKYDNMVGLFNGVCFKDFFNNFEEYQIVSLIFLIGLDIREQEKLFLTTASLDQSARMAEYITIFNLWAQNIENSGCLIVECLLLIQAYDHLNTLGLNINDLKNYFLPKCVKTCFFIQPLNKVIHEICETLTAENKMALATHIKKLRKNYEYNNEFCIKHCKFILLKYITEENDVVNPSNGAQSASSNVQGLIKFFEKEKLPHQIQLLISSDIPLVIPKFRENFERYMKRHLLLTNTSSVSVYNEDLRTTVSSVDYDILSNLENEFQLHEKISLVFLLYDDTKEALKRSTLIPQCSAGIEIDLLKCYQYNLNLLSDWASGSDEYWREKILESFLIIQTSRQIKKLKLESLNSRFLPKCLEKKNFIHPLKKALYLMCESLTVDCKKSIVKSVVTEEKNTIITDRYDENYFELFILKLINEDYITLSSRIEENEYSINRKDLVPSNLSKLLAQLEEHKCVQVATELKKAVALSNQEVEKFVYCIRNNTNMGYVLLIDQNEDHKMCQHTEGEEIKCNADQIRLVETWKSFGFTTLTHENLDSKGIISTLKETITKKVEKEHSAFVLCILSRGLKGDVYGSDDRLVKVDDIEEVLHYPELKGKPKIVIIASQESEHATLPMSDYDIPEKADVLNLSSNANNLLTCNGKGQGTKFIQTICSNLEKSGDLMSLMKIWLNVNAELTKWTNSEQGKEFSFITTSFRKYLYLQKVRDDE